MAEAAPVVRSLSRGRIQRGIPPDWNAAKGQWDTVRAFFAEHGLDRDEVYALSMATAELLENAVKYGDWASRPDAQIGLALEVDPTAATIEVHSAVHDDDAALRRLDDRIQWIRGFQSPFEAYVERLKQVSSQAYHEGDSGLGLIRIAYEARCLVDFYVTPDKMLAMSAVYHPAGLYR